MDIDSLQRILIGQISKQIQESFWRVIKENVKRSKRYSPSICHYWNRPGLSLLTCSPWKFTKLKQRNAIEKETLWMTDLVRWIQGSFALTSSLPAWHPRPLILSRPLSSSPCFSSHPSSMDHCLLRRSKWSEWEPKQLRHSSHCQASQYAMNTCRANHKNGHNKAENRFNFWSAHCNQ